MKRFFDFVCAYVGILILLPIFIVIGILIKVSSKGSIFFTQERIGLKGKIFLIYKFRTMVVNAESLGPKITIGKDKRITKIGQILRKTKLDELPQLFNVLFGDMSLVGPRPEVPEYVNLYKDDVRKIVLSVRPGITDYASLLMIDENDILAKSSDPKQAYINEIMPQKLDLAVKYVEQQSFITDLSIILKTFLKLLHRPRS